VDALEAQLVIEQTRVKPPGLAAILGFFLPALGFFYVRDPLFGVLFLIMDVVSFVLFGPYLCLFLRVCATVGGYAAAKEINESKGVMFASIDPHSPRGCSSDP
jgi:hypothetical protein